MAQPQVKRAHLPAPHALCGPRGGCSRWWTAVRFKISVAFSRGVAQSIQQACCTKRLHQGATRPRHQHAGSVSTRGRAAAHPLLRAAQRLLSQTTQRRLTRGQSKLTTVLMPRKSMPRPMRSVATSIHVFPILHEGRVGRCNDQDKLGGWVKKAARRPAPLVGMCVLSTSCWPRELRLSEPRIPPKVVHRRLPRRCALVRVDAVHVHAVKQQLPAE